MNDLTPTSIVREIEKTGYPLELRTAEKLKLPSSHLAYNLYYVDEDENKGRELDLRWLKNVRRGPKGGADAVWIRYCLAIECKRPSRPWVCLTSPRSSYDQTIASVMYRGSPKLGLSVEELEDAARRHPLFGTETLGRSFFEAFRGEDGDSQSRMFGAVTTAVKATLAMRRSRFGAMGQGSLCFYYPLIVIDGRLFEGWIDGEDVVAREVGSSIISYSYASPAYGDNQLLVPIVRIEELEGFVARMDEAHEFLAERILAAISTVP